MSMMKSRADDLVYSTGPVKPVAEKSNSDAPVHSAMLIAMLRIERKGHGGKTVTLVEMRGIAVQEVLNLAKELKAACGTGGTVRGQIVELQGDKRESVDKFLRNKGIPVKR